MKGRSFFWQIFPYTLLIAAVAAVGVFLTSNRSQTELLYQETENNLLIRSQLVKDVTLPLLLQGDNERLRGFVDQLSVRSDARITIILPDGTVLADSAEDYKKMDNHRLRPEVVQAFEGKIGVARRYSTTLKKDLVYVAIPLEDGEQSTIATLRLASDADTLSRQLAPIRNRNLLILAVILLGCAALAYVRTRRLVWPMIRMKEYAEKIAEKRFQERIKSQPLLPEELYSMASSLNQIASEFNDNMSMYNQKQNEQGVILKSMAEGVIAVDNQETVMHINGSAFRTLDLQETAYHEGIKAHELVRHPGLQKFIRKSLKKRRNREKELILPINQSEKIILVRSSPLEDGKGKNLGSVFVFSDVTDLRKLERHRQEFVSNVSHELKTPLTSIKGFAETLMNPSLNSMDEARKFAGIIQKHADRLGMLIEDLLTLSKLDKVDEADSFQRDKVDMYLVVRSAIECCKPKAQKRGIEISLDGEVKDPQRTEGNSTLLEQAVINLVDNAVKYSQEGQKVSVSLQKEESFIKVTVADQGFGISQEDQKRLFERFYRVDRGRSRDMGGTGLGLSIVKHIAKVHNGDISVESALGKGSTFTLSLPEEAPGASSDPEETL